MLISTCFHGVVASRHPCELSRDFRKTSTSGIDEHACISVDCSSRDMLRIPGNIEHNATTLDLSRNRITTVRSNDFMTLPHLRILILSNNSITSLDARCFQYLHRLERLDLNNNGIASFTSDVFIGLSSLRILTLRGLPLTSYPTEFVTHARDLRVLSLNAIGDAAIPTEYVRLSRLAVLDFYEETRALTKITPAMFENIRDSNITTLAFRSIKHLQNVETGAFSNLPNLRSLILACNRKLSFRATVASLAATSNTSVETVVLDGAVADTPSVFNESHFCSSFWSRVQRLSVKCSHLVGFAFNHTGCLSNIRQFSVEYNSPTSMSPMFPDYTRIFPNMHTLVLSHKTLRFNDFDDAYCYKGNFLFDPDDYFPVRPPVLLTPKTRYAAKPCGEFHLSFLVPPSVEFLYLDDNRIETPRETSGNLCYGNMRFLNYTRNKFTKQLCTDCRVVGLNRVEIIDLSFGALESVTAEFFRNFTSLRFLNVSHNALGVSGTDLGGTFTHFHQLEAIDLSHNSLRRIHYTVFKSCKRLRELILAGNDLHEININLTHLPALEFLDLSGNQLLPLNDAFMDQLDRQYRRRPFELNIHMNIFSCTCQSAPFIRWTRTTHVRLTDKERLSCSYGDSGAVPLTNISLHKLEAECDINVIPIVLPVILGVIFVLVIILLARYHRWYIKYHMILCWETTTSDRTESTQHDATVLYFMHSINPRDQEGGVARISRWVSRLLMRHAENEWGFRLYVGDRDDLGGASKMRNFIRGFQSSDKVVVCLTREFIDDSDCMNYLATALDSSKPLSKYIFVLFDDIQPTSVPRRLRQLLLPNSPSRQLTWGCTEDDNELGHEGFWGTMRDALMHNPGQMRCRRRFDVLSFLARIHETDPIDREPNENSTQIQCVKFEKREDI